MHPFTSIAREIITKDIKVKALSGEPVTVICDPTEVRSHVHSRCLQLGSLRAAQCTDRIRVENECRFRPTWDSNVGTAFLCQQ